MEKLHLEFPVKLNVNIFHEMYFPNVFDENNVKSLKLQYNNHIAGFTLFWVNLNANHIINTT